jgi:hypothetical protein
VTFAIALATRAGDDPVLADILREGGIEAWERSEHLKRVQRIVGHPIFPEQKAMTVTALGESDLSDTDVATVLYLYIRGRAGLRGAEHLFGSQDWARHELCVAGVIDQGFDFEQRFDANAFGALSETLSGK